MLEFKEYATEIDVNFVRKAVMAIGQVAIKLEKGSEKCLRVLVELIQTNVNYVVQEAVIVIKDIFRKYPDQYESVLTTLCENLESLDEPAAKASMAWILGEYGHKRSTHIYAHTHAPRVGGGRVACSRCCVSCRYADRIDNSPELLESFAETFLDEDEEIQQQILTVRGEGER